MNTRFYRSSRFLSAAALAALGLCLLVAEPARATLFCVGTPSALINALDTASVTLGSHEIRVRQGTYVMPDNVYFENLLGGDLIIVGGWNDDCTIRNVNPWSTTIDGSDVGPDASWHLGSGATEIVVAQLHFFNVYLQFDDLDTDCVTQGQRFRVDRSVFDGTESDFDATGVGFASNCHRMELENSLLLGGGAGAGTLGLLVPPDVRFVHNTILNADVGILINYRDSFVTGNAELFNNIIHGSKTQDLLVWQAGVLAIGNNWQTVDFDFGGAFLPGSTNNVSVDPQLQANGRPVEPGSPVINSASLNVPGGLPAFDLDANPRVVGSAPDRGAFETAISDSSTLLVTSSADRGPGTLRNAILSANGTPGAHLIQFDMGTLCPATIFLQTPLPSIANSGLLLIDGYSQPGSSPNSLEHGFNANICVHIRADEVFDPVYALRVPAGSPALLWLTGVAFGGFSGAALELFGGNGHVLHGNRFGGNSGTLPGNAGVGIWLDEGASGVQIGGSSSPGFRNIIQNNDYGGIFVDGSTDTVISNNYIGTNLDGSAAVGNSFGVLVFGGASGTKLYNNVISGNTSSGVALAGDATTGTVLSGNRIGVKRQGAPGSADLGNGGSGVLILGAHHNSIGGGRVTGNFIAFNDAGGVVVETGRGNRINRNIIHSNTGLGIDLAQPGVNPNDDDSGPHPLDYANRGLNYPVLTSAVGDSHDGTVSGSLTTTPGTYLIEIFAHSSLGRCLPGNPEGAFRIGGITVENPFQNPGPTTPTVHFTVPVHSTLGGIDGYITATATDAEGNTSEFSAACKAYLNEPIFVDGFEGT